MSDRFGFGVRKFLVAAALIVASCVTQAQSPPSAPAVTSGNYQVNWQFQGVATYLQEKVGPSGTWAYVSNTLYSNSGVNYLVSFNKPAGEYFYRLEVLYTSYYGGTYYGYSTEIRVQVASVPATAQDLMANQLRYTYTTRIGDINADGRQDVLVQRTSGGNSGNGSLDTVILRRLADGTFTADVPTATQAATAWQWPLLNTSKVLRDLNLDGYVDVELPNLASAISGAVGQIIFAPGQPGNVVPQRVAPMNAKYNKFIDNMIQWLRDPNYFVNNAPIVYVPVYSYIWTCGYRLIDYYYAYDCWLDWGVVGYQAYADFSAYDIDAVNMRYSFNQVINGILQPTIIPGSNDATNIGRWFTNVFGVPLLRGILGNNCYDYPYDPVTHLPCLNYSLIGQILLTTVKAEKPADTDYRLLTAGEKILTSLEGMSIVGVDQVRVYNHGYDIWFYAYENDIIAPDGNVYIGRTNPMLAFAPDYAGDWQRYSRLLHELVHVYQCNNKGMCGLELFVKRGGFPWVGDYQYWPLVQGQAFADYSIEEQGEMVQDRYRLRFNPLSGWLHSDNYGAYWGALDAVIPFREQW